MIQTNHQTNSNLTANNHSIPHQKRISRIQVDHKDMDSKDSRGNPSNHPMGHRAMGNQGNRDRLDNHNRHFMGNSQDNLLTPLLMDHPTCRHRRRSVH